MSMYKSFLYGTNIYIFSTNLDLKNLFKKKDSINKYQNMRK